MLKPKVSFELEGVAFYGRMKIARAIMHLAYSRLTMCIVKPGAHTSSSRKSAR